MNQHVVLDLDANREIVPNTGVILFRSQSPADQATLRKVCERDRVKTCKMRWVDDHRFVIEPSTESAPLPVPDATAKEKSRLMSAKVEDLKTLAGERGVAWDKDASRETMVERIMAKPAGTAAK